MPIKIRNIIFKQPNADKPLDVTISEEKPIIIPINTNVDRPSDMSVEKISVKSMIKSIENRLR